jgi:hypothetical protein
MIALMAALTSASPLRAQVGDDAEGLIAQGIALRRDHKNAEALELFRRAFALAPGPRVQAHMGLAEQAVGKWVEAERDIQAGLEVRDEPWIVKNRGSLEKALAIVVDHLGWIEIKTEVTDAEIWINGAQLSRHAGESIRVVAGTNVVEVRATGYLPAMRTLLVIPNTRMTESFELRSLPKPSPPADPEPAASPSATTEPPPRPRATDAPTVPGTSRADAKVEKHTSPLVYGSLVLGGVSIAIGSVTGIMSLSRAASAKKTCIGNACSEEARGDIDASKSLGTVSDVSLIVGGAGVAVGLVAWLLQSNRPVAVSAKQPAPGVSEVAPVVGPRWMGIMGRF